MEWYAVLVGAGAQDRVFFRGVMWQGDCSSCSIGQSTRRHVRTGGDKGEGGKIGWTSGRQAHMSCEGEQK